MPDNYMRKYQRNVPRVGRLPQPAWERTLKELEHVRGQLPAAAAGGNDIVIGKMPSPRYGMPPLKITKPLDEVYANQVKPIADELGIETPSAGEFSRMSPQQRAKALQQTLTRFSQKFKPNEFLEDGNQGQDQGQGQPGKGDGQGQPSPGKGKPSNKPAEGPPQGSAPSQAQGEPEKPDVHDFEDPHESGEAGKAGEYTGELDDDWEEDEEEEEGRSRPTGGGGDQIRANNAASPEQSIFEVIKQMLEALAVSPDYADRDDLGEDVYDLRRIIAARASPMMLNNAKRDRPVIVEDMYLMLDTSGSVSEYAGKIAAMAAGAAGLVHIFTGTEARPEFYVDRNRPLASAAEPFPEWRRQKSVNEPKAQWLRFIRHFDSTYLAGRYTGFGCSEGSFEAQFAWWLEKWQPRSGSRIIFWGDTHACGFAHPKLFKSLCEPYRVIWLLPQPRNEWERYFRDRYGASRDERPTLEQLDRNASDYHSYEHLKLEAIGIPCLFGIHNPVGIRQALQLIA